MTPRPEQVDALAALLKELHKEPTYQAGDSDHQRWLLWAAAWLYTRGVRLRETGGKWCYYCGRSAPVQPSPAVPASGGPVRPEPEETP